MTGRSPDDCLIFDANTWIFLFTGANRRAAQFLESATRGGPRTVVDRYVLSEVFNGFDGSGTLGGSETDEAKNTLFALRGDEPTIEIDGLDPKG